MSRFIPKRGKSSDLVRLPIENGLFIISVDDRKLYTDVILDGTLQRVPLGGDYSLNGLGWSHVTNKPFDTIDLNDFAIVDETIDEDTIHKLTVSSNLKFSNRIQLNKISESQDGELLYDNVPVGKIDRLIIKGILSSGAELNNIENPLNGDVYLIGSLGTAIYDKMVYIVYDETENLGRWEPLYLTSISFTTLSDLPTINGVTVTGNLSLEDLGINAGLAPTTITLTAANWQGAAAPYTQAVTVQGMTASDYPIVDFIPADSLITGIAQEQQWSYITKAVTSADTITFSCYENKPTVDFTVVILK